MKHFALPRFWRHYGALPEQVKRVADRNFKQLKANPYHPSLHSKKVGESNCGPFVWANTTVP